MVCEDAGYLLEFDAKLASPDLGKLFLSQAEGSALGAASANGSLDFALSGAEFAVPHVVTAEVCAVSLRVPDALILSDKGFDKDTALQKVPVLFLDARARLNITGTRLGVAIDGVVCDTLSANASVLVKDLVSDTRVVSDSEVVQIEPVAFELVPLRYGGLQAHVGVCGVQNVRAVRVCDDGTKVQVALALVQSPPEVDCTTSIIQQMYDHSWRNCDDFKFAPSSNLTKAVMSVPCGLGGCGYSPAAAVNDTPPSFSDALTENILTRCLLSELTEDEFVQLVDSLSAPNPEAACKYANVFGNALSCFAAYAMVYRVDGVVRVMPTGLAMSQSESWRAEPLRSILQADDCDGSACLCTSIIAQAEAVAARGDAFPVLRALANVAAFYVYGTAVLAANAGNADAADPTAAHVAGHAICLNIPKTTLFAALKRGAGIPSAKGKPSILEEHHETAADAWFEALFPLAMRQLVSSEDFQSRDALEASEFNDPIKGFQVVAIEGTTLASSCLYTHDADDRAHRHEMYARDKKLAELLSPNITRAHKCLDSGGKNATHAFYSSFVELSLSMNHALFTNATLRDIGAATNHFRFTHATTPDAGASPHALATGEFAAVGLWYVGQRDGADLDEANNDAARNVMPRRNGALKLSEAQHSNLAANIETFRQIQEHLQLPEDDAEHSSRSVLSFAALVGNPAACEAFKATILDSPGLHGKVTGIEEVVPGLATDPDEKECGRFLVIELSKAI